MSEMNICYYDCIKIMESKPDKTKDDFEKMISKWESESNLRREQAYYSFQGNRIWISENRLMSTAESISEVLS